MNDKGVVLFEIGYDQGEKIKDLAKSILSDYSIEVRKDISNNDRIVIIELN
jgi:release factor glutamine methyltransferase